MDEKLYNVKELAERFMVTVQTVRLWMTNYTKGNLDKPYIIPTRIGRRTFVNQTELDNFQQRYVR